jgi:hypothetical protein
MDGRRAAGRYTTNWPVDDRGQLATFRQAEDERSRRARHDLEAEKHLPRIDLKRIVEAAQVLESHFEPRLKRTSIAPCLKH